MQKTTGGEALTDQRLPLFLVQLVLMYRNSLQLTHTGTAWIQNIVMEIQWIAAIQKQSLIMVYVNLNTLHHVFH
jgi:hypothetical protein